MKQTIKLVAVLAIVSVGLFAGTEIMSSNVGGNKSTLTFVNVEALSNEEQNNNCRWERKTDVCGCVYMIALLKATGISVGAEKPYHIDAL